MKPIGQVWTFAIGSPARPRAVIRALIEQGIEGATVQVATGLWHGKSERTVQAHIAGLTRAQAQAVGERLRVRFKQEAVYLESAGKAFLI